MEILYYAPILWAFVYPELSAERDYQQMQLDAEKNSLQGTFHTLGLVLRVLSALCISLVYFLTRLPTLACCWLAFAGVWFWFWFDFRLNQKRGKPDPFYVSLSPKAAWFDRQLVKLGKLLHTTPEHASIAVKLALLLPTFGLLILRLLWPK